MHSKYKINKNFYNPQFYIDNKNKIVETYQYTINNIPEIPTQSFQPSQQYQPTQQLTLKQTIENVDSVADPKVWGPGLWLTLHSGATKYPEKPSLIVIEKMKNFVLGIPYIIPCENCAEHSRSFIQSKLDQLDTICSSRDNLFNFYVDFHNYVNKNLNKLLFSYEEARNKYYGSNVTIDKITYS